MLETILAALQRVSTTISPSNTYDELALIDLVRQKVIDFPSDREAFYITCKKAVERFNDSSEPIIAKFEQREVYVRGEYRPSASISFTWVGPPT